MTFYDPAKTLIVDTECYPNFWSIGFRRKSDGKTLVIEHSVRRPATDEQRARIRNLMMSNLIVTYNGIGYDFPMIWKMISGASNAELKRANDQIIVHKMKPWHAPEVLGVEVPRDCFIRKDGTRSDGLWQIDLKEPQPNAFAGLKTLAGRLHAKKMQDLPYSPDTELTEEQMDHVLSYMGNDLENTELVFDSLAEPLELRWTFSKDYGVNLMSKSDAQMGEGVIKKLVEQERGERVYKVDTPAGTTFKFNPPSYIRFDPDSEMDRIFKRTCAHDFVVGATGKVELPEWLATTRITRQILATDTSGGEHVLEYDEMERPTVKVGESIYQMGIGGLHSTEQNRAVIADDEFTLVDFDVASYYPAIIINSGLYPRALGAEFLKVFRTIRDERVAAKERVKAIDLELKAGTSHSTAKWAAEREYMVAKEKGLKIALNGCFGKLGSPYSILYAPHLMIATTLTGQFSLLMLIQRAEKIAGVTVVSANTDGVVMRIPRAIMGPIVKDRVTEGPIKTLIEQWEADTGFVMEGTEYRGIYNRSVNDYIAIKADGKAKWKGVIANPWRADGEWKPDLRGQLMKNPQMPIVANAVVDLITKEVPIENTIRASKDIRDFVTVVKVTDGGTWREQFLGKVVRYYWSKDGVEILKAKPHETTGNFAKVSKTDGCRPLMEMDASVFPDDIDYDAYVTAAKEVLMDIGYDDRPKPIKPLRVWKHSAILHWAIAV